MVKPNHFDLTTMNSLISTYQSSASWYRQPAPIAALFSIASALLLIATSQSPNNDAMLYLVAADTFMENGWHAAELIYKRPLFPALIGGISMLFGTSALVSAYLLNTALMGFLGYSFVVLVKNLGGARLAQWAAAFIIVTYPALCSYRDYLIRDFGYWAFSLAALNFLIQIHVAARLNAISGWLCCNLLAMLFRPEAAFILLLSPVSLLFNSQISQRQRIHRLLILYVPLIALTLAGTALAIWANINPFGRFLEITVNESLQWFNAISSSLDNMHDNLVNHVLSKYSREFAPLSVLLTLVGIFVAETLKAISLPLLLLGLFLWRQRVLTLPRHPAYLATLVIATSVVWIFFLSFQFLQTRYLLFCTLLLLIPLCLGLEKLCASTLKRSAKIVLGALVVILIIDSQISFGYSNRHIHDGIRWLQNNAASDAWIYANKPQLAYLGGGNFYIPHLLKNPTPTNKLPLSVLTAYEYLAVNIKRKDRTLADFIASLPPAFESVAEFGNSRGDRVVILSTTGARKLRHQSAWYRDSTGIFINPAP